MSENRATKSPARRRAARAPIADPGLQLTGADYDALVQELETLRGRHRAELARRLRDARAHGSPADNDDVLAAMEDIAIGEARIARLEETLRAASIVDGSLDPDGRAGLGCAVRVTDRAGRTTRYVLVGRRGPDSTPEQISAQSPVGSALLGARAGDEVEVELPDGRRRSLEVLDVTAAEAVARAA